MPGRVRVRVRVALKCQVGLGLGLGLGSNTSKGFGYSQIEGMVTVRVNFPVRDRVNSQRFPVHRLSCDC